MIKRLAHVCIGATDLDATERFYCSGLGLKKAFDFIRGGKTVGFYLEVAENSYIEVFRQDELQPNAKFPISHMCFEVHDIDPVRRHLTAQGYAVTEKKLGADHSWQAWTADPSGVRIEFHQYTEKSTQLTGENCILD
ncbi:MAG: VOC family protein [Candidatus Hydrogenedentes bacterium]|nr:VOC family protein [Candidatus Hydrogenedentota bacterium]